MNAATERELKIFIPASHLRNFVNLEKLNHAAFEQSYFADSTLEAAYRIIFRESLKIPSLMTGRLRKSQNGNKKPKFFATFKGPYISEYSRAEYETEITESIYKTLLPLCDGYTVRKTRYHLPGKLMVGGRKYPIVAEIDHLTEWSDDFFTIDIEVNSDAHIKALRRGAHSFEFLKHGTIDITQEKYPIRRALSMKFLARNGYSMITQNVIRSLFKKALADLKRTGKSLRK